MAEPGSSSTPAVLYAAKSTEDIHASIPDQLADNQALADREGWTVVEEFSDEGFSAYSGNRGPDLEAAKQLAAKIGTEQGRCVLVAQHSDRFARGAGDAPGDADHLAEVFFRSRRRNIEMWANGQKLDRLRVLIEGERNTEDSARKSTATRDGLRRRKERGEPVGPPPGRV